eukprot:m.81735 g.81735  ORF g.81735 m.81735 type:complete len:142 (-) comp11029_c0_seq1:1991-2416(-)
MAHRVRAVLVCCRRQSIHMPQQSKTARTAVQQPAARIRDHFSVEHAVSTFSKPRNWSWTLFYCSVVVAVAILAARHNGIGSLKPRSQTEEEIEAAELAEAEKYKSRRERVKAELELQARSAGGNRNQSPKAGTREQIEFSV